MSTDYLNLAMPELRLSFQDTKSEKRLKEFNRREERAINDFLLFQGSRSSYSGLHYEVQQILTQLGYSVAEEYSQEDKCLLVEREGRQSVVRLYSQNHYTPGRDDKPTLKAKERLANLSERLRERIVLRVNI